MAQLDLPHLVSDVDRHGTRRWYVRRRGTKKVRLRDEPGSPAFLAAYRKALTATEPAPKAGAPGTLRHAVVSYYGSAEFKRLAPRTRTIRRRALDLVCEKTGGSPLRAIKPSAIRRRRDELAETPEAANAFVKNLRQVLEHAKTMDWLDHNPAKEVPYIQTATEGFHAWTMEEVRQFEAAHPIGSTARLALALLLYTGLRRSDVVQLGRQHIRGARIEMTLVKGRSRKPITIDIPLIAPLRNVIAATPAAGHLTFLITAYGRPFTGNGFGNRMRKWCDAAGLPHCSAHGLRKAGATMAAEQGASEHELMAIFGWTTPRQAAHYTRAARRAKMSSAGMKKLARGIA